MKTIGFFRLKNYGHYAWIWGIFKTKNTVGIGFGLIAIGIWEELKK